MGEDKKKSFDEYRTRFAKWLSVDSEMSIWNMYSRKGIPPAILLEHIAGDRNMCLSVFIQFLMDDYKMTKEDALTTTGILATNGLYEWMTKLFYDTADKFDD